MQFSSSLCHKVSHLYKTAAKIIVLEILIFAFLCSEHEEKIHNWITTSISNICKFITYILICFFISSQWAAEYYG
jgi:hypothetical protein